MSQELKVKWLPSASLVNLQLRAQIIKQIRSFFEQRKLLEVETPILNQFAVTDVYLNSFQVPFNKKTHYFLQTSPEYAMKRLLAAGSGSIYQICKSFRSDEVGRYHHPEFTMLEWYRLDFDDFKLMDEVDELIGLILNTPTAKRISYSQLFDQFLSININNCTLNDLKYLINQQAINLDNLKELDFDTCLQILMSHVIEPNLGYEAPCFIYNFPASQAALAKIRYESSIAVAARFELYIAGLEIANGFYELTDAIEQTKRFQQDQLQRKKLGIFVPEFDSQLIAALEHGLPDCAGVALGIDRLVMLATKSETIDQVLSFNLGEVAERSII